MPKWPFGGAVGSADEHEHRRFWKHWFRHRRLMEREVRTPRTEFATRLERFGFSFHTLEGKPYWNEAAAYRFDANEIAELEASTNALHELCLESVEHLITTQSYDRLGIPEPCHKVIERAWEADPPAIYGRFDLCYDGTNPPKLLEYNADTPTSLLEAAVIQWYWLEEAEPGADQFNSIWEGLVLKWKSLCAEGLMPERVHFACVDHPEDVMTTAVLMDTAQEAGLQVELLDVGEIGWDHLHGRFVGREQEPIHTIFKLYPWEWMVLEEFGTKALQTYDKVQWIEPIWKMLLSNKGILAILWELFPEHPNLLPAYLDGPRHLTSYVRKPLLGREGANVALIGTGMDVTNGGDYDGACIYQAYSRLPVLDGNHALIGSWVIDGEARGIGVRESDGPITEDTARFVPHYFSP